MLLLVLCGTRTAHAAPLDLDGRWVRVTDAGTAVPVEQVALTGGRFRFEAEFDVPRADTWVIDFKNSSVIHGFTHEVRDDRGRLVAACQAASAVTRSPLHAAPRPGGGARSRPLPPGDAAVDRLGAKRDF